MATRFYLGTVATVPSISPTPHAEWDVASGFPRRHMFTTPQGSAFADAAALNALTTNFQDALNAQYLYGPMDTAGTLTGTVKGQILARESALGANGRAQLLIHIANGSGVITGTALAGDLGTTTGNQASEFLTTIQNRQFPRGGSIAVTSTSYNVGDWLLVEPGWRKHATSSQTGTLRFGDNAGVDLAENESDTADANTWIEFSHTFPGILIATSPVFLQPRRTKARLRR